MTDDPDPEKGRVYLNLDEVASCNGTVYGWRYCFDDNNDPPQEMVLAMYRPQQDGTYQLVPGSYYELKLEEQVTSFGCRNMTLQPSEQFPVQQGDAVAICRKDNDNRHMELHFSLSDHTLWSWDPGMCSESSIMSSSTYTLSRDDSRVLLLSAFISKGNVFSYYNVILK